MKADVITELARKYVEYDMISIHTALPEFPVPRVTLLYSFLKNTEGTSIKTAETCALAAFLVQLGLDTHDKIDQEADNRQEEQRMRSRQMKVLAGDYFSGVFYALLAQAGEVRLISRMSSSICEVNRLKVRLYTRLKRMVLTAEEYLKESVQVKMGLFLSFSHLLDKSVQNLWELLLNELSHCEVMLEELNTSGELPQLRHGFAYLHIMEHGTTEDRNKLISNHHIEDSEWNRLLMQYGIKEHLSLKLQQAVERVQSLLQDCKREVVRSEIGRVLDPYTAALTQGHLSGQKG